VGGCQSVIKSLSEGLVANYGYECLVRSVSYKDTEKTINGVNYGSVNFNPNVFIKDLKDNKIDLLVVYEDVFVHFPTILRFGDELPFRIVLVSGGGRFLKENNRYLTKLKDSRIKIITHLDGHFDSLLFNKYGIKHTTIPAFINDFEFENFSPIWIRDKYNIKTDKIILCVSNIFPGKGHLESLAILEKLKDLKDKFTVIFAYNSFNQLKVLEDEFIRNLKKLPINSLVLEGLKREEILNLFCHADIFLFPSQKESFGLVILEAVYSGSKVVCMPVGISESIPNCEIIKNSTKDFKDNYLFTKDVVNSFENSLRNMINDDNLKKSFDGKCRILIKEKYSLSSVLEKYNSIFKG